MGVRNKNDEGRLRDKCRQIYASGAGKQTNAGARIKRVRNGKHEFFVIFIVVWKQPKQYVSLDDLARVQSRKTYSAPKTFGFSPTVCRWWVCYSINNRGKNAFLPRLRSVQAQLLYNVRVCILCRATIIACRVQCKYYVSTHCE